MGKNVRKWRRNRRTEFERIAVRRRTQRFGAVAVPNSAAPTAPSTAAHALGGSGKFRDANDRAAPRSEQSTEHRPRATRRVREERGEATRNGHRCERGAEQKCDEQHYGG